ncbi:rCG33557 [Rattus norvegicus]|uniref:RCG33557 n=1 Tax=Rattus norvegicus TaxID=10116 RepID=A6HJS1_RAT|nr:rCG33557 [Rattus norvegicus]
MCTYILNWNSAELWGFAQDLCTLQFDFCGPSPCAAPVLCRKSVESRPESNPEATFKDPHTPFPSHSLGLNVELSTPPPAPCLPAGHHVSCHKTVMD